MLPASIPCLPTTHPLGCHTPAPARFACLPQEVKAKTAQMDADLATQQAALEAQEQAAEIAREKVETMDGRIATLSECAASCCWPDCWFAA